MVTISVTRGNGTWVVQGWLADAVEFATRAEAVADARARAQLIMRSSGTPVRILEQAGDSLVLRMPGEHVAA